MPRKETRSYASRRDDLIRAVKRSRKRKRDELLSARGSRCELCGYNRCPAALHFHHVDPSKKSFSLQLGNCTKPRDVLAAEAAKCVLVCANCHAEIHAGLR